MTSQVNSIIHKDPKNFCEAKNSALWMQWQESMREEVEALKTLGTFIMTVREPNMTTLHSKWVYKTKTQPDGQIERFKSRLVACGNEQVHGENYDETFAPTLEMTSVMLIFALSIHWNVPVMHGDTSVIIGLYVDDLLVTGTNQKMVDELFNVAFKMDITSDDFVVVVATISIKNQN
jgi:hypothetical protein